jgi:hypothetical protein
MSTCKLRLPPVEHGLHPVFHGRLLKQVHTNVFPEDDSDEIEKILDRCDNFVWISLVGYI